MNKQNDSTNTRVFKMRGRLARRFAALITLTLVFALLQSGNSAISEFQTVRADNTYYPLSAANPLQQSWSDANLITVNNDWNGVPSIIGYAANAGGFGFGIDPQTITTDFYSTTPQIFANQTLSNTPTNGSGGFGFAEFAHADPSVGFRPTVSRYAPNLDIRLDTTNCPAANDVRVSYNLRDIDAGGNNAVSQFALQYRIGSAAGDYTNIPAGYVADATTGPNLAALVTNVNAALPAAAKNQPELHVRVITTDAVGWDEWVGIDDINISCASPTAAAAAVEGRVATPRGRGVGRVSLTLTSMTGETLKAQTDSSGYYRFAEVPAGETYVLQLHSKTWRFAPGTTVLNLTGEINGLNFTAFESSDPSAEF